MSDEHDERGAPDDGPAPPVGPEWYQRPEVRPVLASRDIGALYRLLGSDAGLTQREIAAYTGQSQSEVSEIFKGRRVIAYDVHERIATGLGIPPELMGMSWWGPDGTYCGGVTGANTPKGVSAEMLRRHLLALGATAAFGPQIKGLGELLEELGDPEPVPVPSRLDWVHVAQVRDLTRRLAEAGNTCISNPVVLSAAAAWATRLLDASGTEALTRALRVAVAELHIEAGWSAFDAGLYQRALHHYARALELATAAGDAYLQATALNYAGWANVEHGHPGDGLKMLQLAQVTAWKIPTDDHRAVVVGVSVGAAVEAGARVASATALIRLGDHKAAGTQLVTARQLWTPTRTDPYGDLDRPAARLEIERGRLDIAESLAAASVRRWEGGSQLSRTLSGIMLATIHVKAGEPSGLSLAHHAITSVPKLSSVRARTHLEPLAEVLQARPGSDARELARMTRQVATSQV
jgi:transcriptional regulator with XRE-family HTH domain